MRRHRKAFTLTELLVVIAIILMVSIIALPAVYRALNGRQISDGARVFTGALVGMRDATVSSNKPRGIRLLPDPTLTRPPLGSPAAGTIMLAYNRMVAIEPATDLTEGRVNIGPQLQAAMSQAGFPPAYHYPGQPAGATDVYPFPNTGSIPSVLMVEESPFAGGFSTPSGQPNAPTNWYWTVRVGDKVKIGSTGRTYTIVGPCTISPWSPVAAEIGNPEMFVNVGPPGTTPPLVRTYYGPAPTYAALGTRTPEFLFLVNGADDDNDGWVDEGFDGFNQNPPPPGFPPGPGQDLVADNLIEWEIERWISGRPVYDLSDTPATPSGASPSRDWVIANDSDGTWDVAYAIQRRPVPSQGARETPLPGGIVIDATAWNTTQERSRLPIEAGSLHCDIMVNPRGSYLAPTPYSTPTSTGSFPFLHFWLAEANDVHPRGAVWGVDPLTGVPNTNPKAGLPPGTAEIYELPVATDALGPAVANYPPTTAPNAPLLKGDRRLVTMFARSGLVVTNPIETLPASGLIPGEGFNVNDVNWPYQKAQLGQRGAR